MINDSSPRIFSYYSSLDELFETYKQKGQEEIAKGNVSSQDYTDSNFKSFVPDIYPNTKELTDLIENFSSFKDSIDSGGAFKKSRIKLSEDKRFMFSFSLASKGLIRVPEYYNNEIATKFPKMFNSVGTAKDDSTMVAGVVDTNIVESRMLGNGQTYFFVNIDKEYPLRQQQKGTAKMLEINSSAILTQTEGGMFFTEPSFYNDFSLVFSSSFKKSYLEMPKEGGNAPAVDIYVPFDMYNQLMTKITPAIPLILASEYLMRARIKVRINVMRPIGVNYNTMSSSIVAFPIKDFSDPIDWNKLAVLRGLKKAGKLVTEANAYINQSNMGLYERTSSNQLRIKTDVLGRPYASYADILLYDEEELLQQEFGRYKNWFRKEVEEGRIKSKLVEKPLMLTFSTSGLLGKNFDLANPQNYPDELEIIENGFFEILDSIDLYYNKKEGEVVRRILKRFEQKNPIDAESEAKNYIIKLIGKIYRDYEPTNGVFASTPEELKKANENYTIKLKKVSEQFKKLGI
jgi:hypothetical protein